MDCFNEVLSERVEFVLEQGDLVASNIHYNYGVLLFSLGKDFVELIYDKTTNNILWMMMVENYDLRKYLNKIDINLEQLL